MKTILLTNDDGFYSKGILSLKIGVFEKITGSFVAPDREKSAISMALTLNHPLRINQIEDNVYAVNGTTSDCVNIALQKIFPQTRFRRFGDESGRKPFRRYFFFGNGRRSLFRISLRHSLPGGLPDRQPGELFLPRIRF